MSPRRPLTHWLLLFALVAMWGTSFLLTKVAVAAIAPLDLVAGRFVLGTAVLLALLIVTRRRLPAGGRLWICWPKKASGVPTDVTQQAVRSIGLAAGIVDFKICAIDETWSGLCFANRKA